jgi:hypothetical protein
MQYIVALQTNPGIKCFDVKKSAQDAYNQDSQSWLKANSVWNEDCGGWLVAANRPSVLFGF